MRSVVVLLAAVGLAACAQDPVAQQADRRHALRSGAGRHHAGRQLRARRGRPRRRPGQRPAGPWSRPAGGPSATNSSSCRTDRAGRCSGPRAQRVGQVLSDAGARWVSTSVEPAMAMGPNTVVVVRSEYLLGLQQLPELQPRHHRQSQRGGDAGLRLRRRLQYGPDAGPPARRRGRPPARPGRRHDQCAAIARYREGKVAALDTYRHVRRRGGWRRWRRRRWRRRRFVGLEQLRLRHVGFRNRAALAVRCRRRTARPQRHGLRVGHRHAVARVGRPVQHDAGQGQRPRRHDRQRARDQRMAARPRPADRRYRRCRRSRRRRRRAQDLGAGHLPGDRRRPHQRRGALPRPAGRRLQRLPGDAVRRRHDGPRRRARAGGARAHRRHDRAERGRREGRQAAHACR